MLEKSKKYRRSVMGQSIFQTNLYVFQLEFKTLPNAFLLKENKAPFSPYNKITKLTRSFVAGKLIAS